MRGSLVENDNIGRFEDEPCDGETLFLAPGEAIAPAPLPKYPALLEEILADLRFARQIMHP